MTHIGIVVLLVGQLATDMFSRESHLRLREGETRNFTESQREQELVFATDVGDGNEEVVSIPEAIVAQGGEIAQEKLPFVVKVKAYQVNSAVLTKASVVQAAGKLAGAIAQKTLFEDKLLPRLAEAIEAQV